MSAVLDAVGWTSERRAGLASDQPLTATDTRDLLLLADRLQRFAPQIRADTAAAGKQPLDPVEMQVQVISTEQLQSGDGATATPYLRVTANEGDRPLTLLANDVPDAWLAPGVLPQQAEVVGLRIRDGAVVAIAWRWLPEVARYPHVNFGESVLASLGVDVGSLDRFVDGGRLQAVESAPFYATLAAMRQIGPHQLVRFARGNLPTFAAQWTDDPAAPPRERALAREVMTIAEEGRYPIAPLFNDALNQRGELYLLEGVARRAVAIETAAGAGARSVSAEHGVDRYYEIELFTDDSRNLPVVFCALELPPGFPLGDKIEVPVRAAGFSLKRWGYHTRRQSPDGGDKPQLAPLLIGRAPIVLSAPADAGAAWGVIVGLSFAAAVAAVWVVVWRVNRSDAAFERAVRERAAVPADQLSRLGELDGLSTDAADRQNEGP
ncbi:hypothetical protein KOR34_46530 [Posidoniimonas corsicana]|uniref:Uncharacterized protein n=2 Tax=Posidoniimonas corsicana TaxID=1938618 RepID=A0A5C5V0H2_9BACT|nr:hypothetical protein KOR34_46530 [Posidoniimonas corsicana]